MPTVPSRIHRGVAIAADQLLAERLHHRPVTLHDPHVRRGAAQPLLHTTRERFELRHQRCALRSRLHARHRSRSESAGLDLRGADLQRHPEGGPLIRETELRLHDADHFAVLSREAVTLANHVRLGAEPGLPEPVAEHDDLGAVLIGRQPAVQRLHAQRREEGRRRLRQEQLVDMPFRSCRRRSGAVQSDVLDPGRAFAVLEIQLVRHAELFGLIRAGGRAGDVDQPVRVRERQRTEEHGTHDAENRRVRADGERERRDDDEREARRAAKAARGVLEVPDPCFQHWLHLLPFSRTPGPKTIPHHLRDGLAACSAKA